MKKKIVSLLISLSMLCAVFCVDTTVTAIPLTEELPSPTTFAADIAEIDTASYIETETGDTISLEVVTVTSTIATCKSLSSDVYATRIFRNNVLEETLYVDFANNILRHEYPNGIVLTEILSNVVTVSEVSPSTDDRALETILATSEEASRATDYIDNEPFTLSASGVQKALSGAAYYSGYQAMGYRGGYYYAPTTFGYLQRKNAGVEGTYYSHRFEFSAGTQIGTAASIIVAFFTSGGVGGIALSVAIALLGPIIDVVTYDWSTVFEVKSYEWQYRVRLNSNTGTIISTSYRTKDYWKSYNPANGDASYEYRGSAYDWGFLLSNYEMIKSGIDSYLEGLN